MAIYKSVVPVIDIGNVSFIVNTKKCGKGSIKCVATHADGKEAVVINEKLEEYIYRIKVLVKKTGPLHLHIDYVPPNSNIQLTSKSSKKIKSFNNYLKT
ncbi:unnamed protein product [Brachionus calyciflorus]|uniref:Uncharacterized protein n=1 Tax=Brachionus calyciflorus TaxID=104777 RepID=A0A813WEJ1_9BILA|nr:unnamed protein product [Brachionus calyciflorus]